MSTTQEVLNVNCLDVDHTNFRDFVLLTDPPYSARVHERAISCGTGSKSRIGQGKTKSRDLGFAPLTDELRTWTASVASVCTWNVIFSDIEGASTWRTALPRYIRTIPWIRWSMPQLTGDRPPQASEYVLVDGNTDAHLLDPAAEIVLGYRAKGRLFFNGPGNLTHFDEKCLRGSEKHKCEKPLDLCLRLVEYFSREGDTVVDPFAGSGAIGVACRELGRNYVGLEVDPVWAERANERLKSPLSERDRERLERFLSRVGHT